jgi:CheY-like chemotaxis protein
MTKRVLIVDDQGELRMLVRMTLESSDYELHEAGDGSRTLDLLGVIKPHLVVLDIMMPGSIDGLKVCETIKNQPELMHIKVILLSAKGQQADLECGHQAGADAYLVKPFSPLDLIKTVSSLLA